MKKFNKILLILIVLLVSGVGFQVYYNGEEVNIITADEVAVPDTLKVDSGTVKINEIIERNK